MQKSHEKANDYWITYLYICKPAELFKYITDMCRCRFCLYKSMHKLAFHITEM